MSVYLSEYIDPTCRAKLEDKFDVVDNFDKPEEVEAIILRVFPVDAELMDKLPNILMDIKNLPEDTGFAEELTTKQEAPSKVIISEDGRVHGARPEQPETENITL